MGPTKGGPHKSIFQVNISCLFGWVLFANMEPVCTIFFPLGKADHFQVWCYRPFLGLANIEPVYIRAKIFEWILGMESSVNRNLKENHTQKTTNSADHILIKSLLKTTSKSYIFGPHKWETPQEHFFS